MMNCEFYEILISSSIDDELTINQQQQLESHLHDCQDCRAHDQSLKILQTRMQEHEAILARHLAGSSSQQTVNGHRLINGHDIVNGHRAVNGHVDGHVDGHCAMNGHRQHSRHQSDHSPGQVDSGRTQMPEPETPTVRLRSTRRKSLVAPLHGLGSSRNLMLLSGAAAAALAAIVLPNFSQPSLYDLDPADIVHPITEITRLNEQSEADHQDFARALELEFRTMRLDVRNMNLNSNEGSPLIDQIDQMIGKVKKIKNTQPAVYKPGADGN